MASLRAAIGFGKARGVERVEAQRLTRSFCIASDIIACLSPRLLTVHANPHHRRRRVRRLEPRADAEARPRRRSRSAPSTTSSAAAASWRSPACARRRRVRPRRRAHRRTTWPTPARSTCCSNAPPSRRSTPATTAARPTCSQTNLTGTINCLEAARRTGADVIFLSTSRVYPIAGLRALPLERRGDRLDMPDDASGPGWSRARHRDRVPAGGLPLDVRRDQARLGAAHRRVPGDVRPADDRQPLRRDLGPLADGKGRSGLRRAVGGAAPLRRPLSYIGFGGEGLQVRDVLHVADLYDLIRLQIADIDRALRRRATTSAAAASTACRSPS